MTEEAKQGGKQISSIVLSIILSIVIVSGCSMTPTAAQSVAPPIMPAHWKVTSDVSFSAADIDPIAARLGGAIAALRNTVYDVEGKRVQLNTIVATDEANADKIMVSLRKMKSEDSLFRSGLTIYEFVGSNNALPEIRAGKAHLKSAATDPQ